MKIESNWSEICGQQCLYIRPKVSVFDEDWIKFFTAELESFRHEVLFLLVDDFGVEDNIGFDGFQHLTNLLTGLNVQKVRIAVVKSDMHFPDLANMFVKVGQNTGLDLNIELHQKYENAEAWLSNQ